MYVMRGLFDGDRPDLNVLDMLILQESLNRKEEKEKEKEFFKYEGYCEDYKVTENEWYEYEEE